MRFGPYFFSILNNF